MKVRYLAKTDTVHIELRRLPVAVIQEFCEDTSFELADDGSLVAIILERATLNAGMPEFAFEELED